MLNIKKFFQKTKNFPLFPLSLLSTSLFFDFHGIVWIDKKKKINFWRRKEYEIYLGYSQEKLIENGIDLKEASILRLVADLHKGLVNKKKYSVFNNEIYVWFTYGYLARQFPIAGSEKTIMRKINELVEKGFLKKIIK